jgi:hypothetical protein
MGRNHVKRYRMMAALGALTLLAAACGDDDESGTTASSAPATTQAADATTVTAADTTTAATTADTTDDTTADTTDDTTADTTDDTTADTTDDTTADTTDDTTDDTTAVSVDPEFAAVCALATEMDEQEMPPTAEQLTAYLELAPDEIRSDVEAAATPLLEVEEGDMVAFFNVIADDEVEQHTEAIDAWEEENCGIDHSRDTELAPGASQEIEDDAARVDVIGRDYEFEFESPTEAGRTSFVLTNEGQEAHFLLVVKLAEGVNFQEALESQDPTGLIEGEWDTKLAAAAATTRRSRSISSRATTGWCASSPPRTGRRTRSSA